MKLIILDIDGTILDSVEADDKCFIEVFNELYRIDLKNRDWNSFEHVTDMGLTVEIFEKWLSRRPLNEEIEGVKIRFKELLECHVGEFREVENALSFIQEASAQVGLEIGFATGGWKETAELKCNSIGLNLHEYIFKSSNDHFDRSKIIQLVIETAMNKYSISEFESITYFGDGLWDLASAQKIGIDFIGVDSKSSGILKSAGAQKTVKDFTDLRRIFEWINYQ